MSEFDTKIPTIKKPKLDHLNRQIPPEAHTPMYNWHKFWSRKTWNVVGEFIKTYSKSTEVVFDPFAGSGVTAMEALKNDRRVIVSDILPISTEIIRLTIKPVSIKSLHEAFKRVEEKVKRQILKLYLTKCRKCGNEFPFTCSIWAKNECQDIRYTACPKCGDRREKNTPLDDFDINLLSEIEKSEIKEWYPKQRLYHANGKPFMKKEKYESIDELFTKRNLRALAMLMATIEDEPNRDLRDFLKIGFSSIVHLCTKMCPISEGGHFTPFSSAWTQHSYWYPSGPYMEQNVWRKFESSILGTQGLLKAKEEANKYFSEVRFGNSFEEVFDGKANVFIYCGSSSDLMDQIRKRYGDNGSIDYIFTDPPYDSSVQYGELAYLWVTWLKLDDGYLEKIASDEVIHNERQDKDFNSYHSLLSHSFEDMFSVLKPNKYLTVTFHNPTFKVRNATIRAGVFAGFELQKIHHQELARPSAKSLLQPFGSAQGDFYLRFYKPDRGEESIKPEAIDEVRFERIVLDTAIRIIAERGEPTPYTIIINAIDPELARRGFFSELHSGLDIKTVLEKHLEKELTLVEAKIGGVGGKLWWLKDPNSIPHLEKVPLTERVEQTVLRQLQQKGKVTFTEVWDAVSTEFPNSLTSDSMSIIDALKAYAKPIAGKWLIKTHLRPDEIEREHTTIISEIAEIGKSRGFDIWVGKVEQAHELTATSKRSGQLKQYVSFSDIAGLQNANNPDVIENIDVIWIKDKKITSLFEIEATTSMTSGLQRGSNVEQSIPKFLVIPEDREKQLIQKLKSPMFSDRFNGDHWRVLFFESLKNEFTKHKGKTLIENLVNKKINKLNKNTKRQLDLFNK